MIYDRSHGMLSEQIDFLIHDAIKGRKTLSYLNVLRNIKTEFTKYLKSSNDAKLTDDIEYLILKKMSDSCKESMNMYLNGGRADLFEKEKSEFEIIAKFLPAELSREDAVVFIKDQINEYINVDKEAGYVLSMKDMRCIISKVKNVNMTIDGKLISEIFREFIQ